MLSRVKRAVGVIGRRHLGPVAARILIGDMSYAAAGEDRLVLGWLQTCYGFNDASRIRYCDIGANHPQTLSNTYLLYQRGARGLLIEPDPELCAPLRQKRPRDTVLNVGVAFDARRSAKLKRFSSPVFNTFNESHADLVVNSSKNWQPNQLQRVVDEIEVPLVPANDVLAAHLPDGFDFLSIDAEGVDFEILRSIDLRRFRPAIICIEESTPKHQHDEYLGEAGYDFVARTPDNLIYRRITA